MSEHDELDAVAEELVSRGLGEGVDFFVSGRSPVDLSSEYVGLRRLDDGSYGYCEETGEPISLSRLEARPIATLSLEAQERHERRERIHRDE